MKNQATFHQPSSLLPGLHYHLSYLNSCMLFNCFYSTIHAFSDHFANRSQIEHLPISSHDFTPCETIHCTHNWTWCVAPASPTEMEPSKPSSYPCFSTPSNHVRSYDHIEGISFSGLNSQYSRWLESISESNLIPVLHFMKVMLKSHILGALILDNRHRLLSNPFSGFIFLRKITINVYCVGCCVCGYLQRNLISIWWDRNLYWSKMDDE